MNVSKKKKKKKAKRNRNKKKMYGRSMHISKKIDNKDNKK